MRSDVSLPEKKFFFNTLTLKNALQCFHELLKRMHLLLFKKVFKMKTFFYSLNRISKQSVS